MINIQAEYKAGRRGFEDVDLRDANIQGADFRYSGLWGALLPEGFQL